MWKACSCKKNTTLSKKVFTDKLFKNDRFQQQTEGRPYTDYSTFWAKNANTMTTNSFHTSCRLVETSDVIPQNLKI